MGIEKDLTLTAKTEGFPEAKAEVDGLGASVKSTASAEETLGASSGKGQAGLDALRASMKATEAEAAALRAGTTAAAEGVSLFSRAVAVLAGPVGVLVAVLVGLLTHIKELGDWFGRVGEKMDAWINGVGQGTPVLDAHGKQVDELAQGYNKAATAQDLHTRALTLARLGIIAATDDLKLLAAETLVHEANFRKSTAVTEELAAAFKKLGIVIPESFDLLKTKGDELLARYKIILENEGPAAARIFAEANKSALDAVVSRYERMGADVPPELKKIEVGLGTLSAAEAEAAKDKGLAERYTKDLRKMGDESADLLKKVASLGVEFLKTQNKVETSARAEIAANDAKTSATIADLQRQVAETEAAHAARTISDTEYNTKINALIAQEQAARSAGFDKEKSIQTEEEAALKANVEARDAAGKAIIDKLQDLGEKQEETKAKFDALTLKMEAQKAATDSASDGFVGLSKQFGVTGNDAVALGGAVSGLDSLFDELASTRVPILLHAFDLVSAKLKEVRDNATQAAAALNSLDGGVSGQ